MADNYYKKFAFVIKKKYTVQQFPILKNYAKLGVYFYLIEDKRDGNRFIFVSSKHYERDTAILPDEFELFSFGLLKNNFLIHKKNNEFGETYFVPESIFEYDETKLQTLTNPETKKEDKGFQYNDSGDIYFVPDSEGITLKCLIFESQKLETGIVVCLQDIFGGLSIYSKYQKSHTKKIAVENPNWYREFLKGVKANSIKKIFESDFLCGNSYNPEIIENAISTFVFFRTNEYSIFNDNFFVLDEGKTGKTSLVSYISEKLDELSMAGLYGSSDSKSGSFRGGIVTKTKRCIIIDELNELVKKKIGEKVLPTLNSVLENGEYNYQKQFGAKIEVSNQFGFLANIKEDFNFSIMLESCFGNTATLGRRIGCILYNNNLSGFKKGKIRIRKPSKLLIAVSLYMTQVFNQIFSNKKFLLKRLTHKLYLELDKKYKSECSKLEQETENEPFKYFLRSHKEAIDRLFCRSVKNWIWKNLDGLFFGTKPFCNHSLFEILEIMKEVVENNLINLNNIKEHLAQSVITSRKGEFNKIYFKKLKQIEKKFLEFFFSNQDILNQNNFISYANENLKSKSLIRKKVIDIKKFGLNKNVNQTLLQYGCFVLYRNNELEFKFINKHLFLDKVKDIFSNDKLEVIESSDFEATH